MDPMQVTNTRIAPLKRMLASDLLNGASALEPATEWEPPTSAIFN